MRCGSDYTRLRFKSILIEWFNKQRRTGFWHPGLFVAIGEKIKPLVLERAASPVRP